MIAPNDAPHLACATTVRGRRATSQTAAAFWIFVLPQFGFWPLRPLRAEWAAFVSDLPKPGLWRGSQRCVRVSLIRDPKLAQETDDAKGHRQVVQSNKRLGVHSALQRRQGRIRSHLGGRARWPQHPQRRPDCRVRARDQSRQVIGGKSQGVLTWRAGQSGKLSLCPP